jgi:hypothetical protein
MILIKFLRQRERWKRGGRGREREHVGRRKRKIGAPGSVQHSAGNVKNDKDR